MRAVRWSTAAIAVALTLTAVGAHAQGGGELAEVNSRLDRIENEIEQAEATAASRQAELADADARLAEVEAIVNDLAVRFEQQQARVAGAQRELDRLQAEADAVRAAFQSRTVEVFKHASATPFDAMLSAGDIQEAVDRQNLLAAVNKSDRATIEQVEATQGAVQTQQEILQLESDRLAALQAEQAVVLERVREIRESRALAAANARAQVVELASQQEQLEDKAAEIERLITERAAPAASIAGPRPAATSGSGLSWPSCGSVTSEYGRRWGRLHAGLDIDDNRGSSISAAASGTVISAGWHSGGYGNLTLIDHGGGIVTAYAHQASIAVSRGQSVSRGQFIGVIGTTGSSTGTHLHFEVRVSGSAHNPRGYLPGGC